MLNSQNYQRVIPAALQAIKYSKELYGSSDIQIVPAYMVIARAYIGGLCVGVCTLLSHTLHMVCAGGFPCHLWRPAHVSLSSPSSLLLHVHT